MIKLIWLVCCACLFFSCQQPNFETKKLQQQIDSLRLQIANSYKPGMGEFMGNIQTHHAKLWFAGQHQNWKLADFEIKEMMEALEDIQKFQAERSESKLLTILNPAIDSLNRSIQEANQEAFNRHFLLLTNTCNNCHQSTQFEFNVVQIPKTSTFTNQDFKSQ